MIRLSHIAEYQNILQTLSPGILRQTLSGRECIHCGYCREIGPSFSYNGVNYVKCSVICAGFKYNSHQIAPEDVKCPSHIFRFVDISNPSIDNYLNLLDMESKCLKK